MISLLWMKGNKFKLAPISNSMDENNTNKVPVISEIKERKMDDVKHRILIRKIDSLLSKETQIETDNMLKENKTEDKSWDSKWLTPFGVYIMNAHFKLSRFTKEDFNRSNLLEELRKKIKQSKNKL